MSQYAFYFDQSRCYGCQTCSVTCKDWNFLAPGAEKWMTVYDFEDGVFPDLRLHILAFGCGHCEKPVCLSACPNGAIFKEEKYGAVLIDPDKCRGTRQCAVACPYGAPKFASDAPGTKMSKCTMCIDRLEKGNIPVCVAACPLRALDFGPLEEMIGRYGDLRQLDGVPAPVTKPAYICRANPPKQNLVPYDKDRAVELMRVRKDMGFVFDRVEDVTQLEPGTVKRTRSAFRMKHTNNADLMDATRNDIG